MTTVGRLYGLPPPVPSGYGTALEVVVVLLLLRLGDTGILKLNPLGELLSVFFKCLGDRWPRSGNDTAVVV